MSENFEKIMLQEFKNVHNKLDNIDIKITNLDKEVTGLKQDVVDLKQDVVGVKQEVTGLKQNVVDLKQEVTGLKQDISRIEERMDRLEYKMDISNTNIASMLERQNDLAEQMKIGHKELLDKFEDYEKINELEHSRLDYEICKLKVRA